MRLVRVRPLAASASRLAARHLDPPAGVLSRPVDDVDADDPDDDDAEGGGVDAAADRRRGLEERPPLDSGDDDDHEQPLEHGRQPADEVRERALRPDGEVAHEQHHRLDRDAADEVPGCELEVSLCRGGDRDRQFRQAAGDREQDQAAERVAEPEPGVERVRRLREHGAG